MLAKINKNWEECNRDVLAVRILAAEMKVYISFQQICSLVFVLYINDKNKSMP